MTKEPEYVGLHLGDLHSGSQVAPCPVKFETSYGSLYQPNKAQEYLNECWKDMIKRLPSLDYIVFGGDAIEGNQPKEAGNLVWEPNIISQTEAAIIMLEPVVDKLKKGGKVWWIRGSKYHVSEVGNMDELIARFGTAMGRDVRQIDDQDESIAQKMGAHKIEGKYSRRWLLIDVGGIVIDIAHRVSVVIRNRTMPLDREIEFALVRCSRSGEEAPFAIVRHHAHCEYVTAGLGLRSAVVVPPWQLQTEFAQSSISPNRYYSAYFGSVLARVYPDRVKVNRRPVVWDDSLLFEHPKQRIERL